MKDTCSCGSECCGCSWGLTVARLVVGVTFLFTAFDKFGDPAGFVGMVKSMNVLPETLATVYGYALPYFELVVGALLVLGLFTRVASWVAAAMFVSFLVGVGIAGYPETAFLLQKGAMMPNKDFAFLALAIVLALEGPGMWALDHKWKK